MDMQNRVGSKKGGGGMASESQANLHRRERLRKLASEQLDISKDPYIFKNHLGYFECRLCLTSHVTDGSYLSHTQGKRHQQNLAKRGAQSRDGPREQNRELSGANKIHIKKSALKIGRPGYKITKVKDPLTKQLGLLMQINFAEIGTGVTPRYRFMSAFEQKVDVPADRRFQYLLIAAEPYETIAFKIPAKELDQHPSKFWNHWDKDRRDYVLQVMFKAERQA
ncbi:hypothetical protein B0I72DRAFT_140431 [Yarrowia lipolytica]|uniref:Uncharacterized protein n=1 Tax=Yarrowia lipolytica TaxID=4952 RepID=A0A371BYY8_YARLL|nr:hypothetical protein BKA91DRAFT_135902 [Yarrowia lipolytica]KAE8170928.1 hypothetical protein BKA90DRAFT_140055 [Yarrowia lipolytica]QNP98185.1 Splicing factor 3A subunit 2 [Yarrowia lipolytica]RDW23319.1 hypothetical protein B0I71DRAFT_136131 [Yarrowia lipolytica]RDW31078.1 hypothetical protein B0I72DRAFT_140431 [Yarrowia lipolytica]